MIRVSRGPEPHDLRRARRKHLARAVLAHASNRAITFAGYDDAREALYKAQHRKCVYCERQQGLEAQPVEHFRPKDSAERALPPRSGQIDEKRYWWLTWTWSNLLFACVTCNTGLKQRWFPLEQGSPLLRVPLRKAVAKLPAIHFGVQGEMPLLIDPGSEDPLDHIAWVPLDKPNEDPESWTWTPVHKSEKGEITVLTFDMRGALSDHVNSHIRSVVWPRVRPLLNKKKSGGAATLQKEWAFLLKELFAPEQPFHAATYDALDQFMPAGKRATFGLPLPRPGNFAADSAPQDLPDPAGAGHLPDDLKLRIRADEESPSEIIEAVCALQSWTIEALAELLNLSNGYVGGLVRELLAAKRLTKVAGTRPYEVKTP